MTALPFLPAGIKIQVVLKAPDNPRSAMNVFHCLWEHGSAPSVTDLTSIANNFGDTYRDEFLPSMYNGCTMTQVIATDISSATGLQVKVPRTDANTTAVTPLSHNAAAVISWIVGDRRRGGKPRTYLPFQQLDNTVNPFQWAAGYISAQETNAADFIADINAAVVNTTPLLFGAVSYFSAKALRPVPEFFAIESALVHPRIDSQRRRTGKETA